MLTQKGSRYADTGGLTICWHRRAHDMLTQKGSRYADTGGLTICWHRRAHDMLTQKGSRYADTVGLTICWHSREQCELWTNNSLSAPVQLHVMAAHQKSKRGHTSKQLHKKRKAILNMPGDKSGINPCVKQLLGRYLQEIRAVGTVWIACFEYVACDFCV
jgi:hypothetical protein